MADLKKTIEIVFGAVDQTGSGLQSVSSNINSAVDSISGVTAPLASVGDKALKTEAAIIALGAAMVGFAVNEAGKFNSAINEIATLTDLTGDAIGAYGDQILKYAQTSTQSLESITSATYSAISAGVDYADALASLSTAERLAVAGKADLNSTLTVLVSSLNAYGVGVDQAERFSDALFNTVRLGQTTLPELGQSLAQVTGLAATAGVDFEELTAAIATLTATGSPTSEAITQIRAALSNILKPSSEAKKLAEELGIEFNATRLQSVGLVGVLDDVQSATGGNTTQMAKLFGSVQALNGVLTLTGLGADKFASTLEEMRNGTGATDAAFAKMAGNIDLATQNLVNNFKVVAIQIGEPLREQWAGIVGSISDLFKGVSISIDDGAFDPVFAALNKFGKNVEDFLRQIAANLPAAMAQVDFTNVIRAFEDLGLNIGSIFDGFDFSTADGLARAIQFVVDSIETLTRVTVGIVDVWVPVIRKMIDYVDALNKADDGTKDFIGQLLGASQVFEKFKGLALGVADGIDLIGKSLTVIAGIKAAELFGSIAASVGAVNPVMVAGAAAVGAVAFAYNENINAFDDYVQRQKAVADASNNLAISQLSIKDRLVEISDRTGIVVKSMDDLNNAVDKGVLVFNDATGAYEKAGSKIRDYDSEVKAAVDSGFDFAAAVNQVASGLIKIDDSVSEAANGFSTLEEAQRFAAKAFSDSNNVQISYIDGLWRVSDGLTEVASSSKNAADAVEDTSKSMVRGSAEWERVQKVMIDTQRVANDFSVEMGKLSNQRYEIDVRAVVDLQTAQIEADTARIQSAFSATAEVIKSLTVGVTDLWGQFSDASRFDKSTLRDAAERMERRLDAELELKRQLTESVVAQADATTRRLLSGEPIIQIDGGQLSPELEMIFDKILEYTQVRASNEGLNLLLGI
jgi:TP901 family phage tail tape measure protein